ncbi:uncharacterized protein LOC106150391 isoform X1 [Lingula anatina]|uniref:Uncharacterized protein LOC106150391 isoform X1 n=1 Tax=Lingula anatina TaxID=7574 RepID=A0A1S3GXL2_LINAN|nr:uncharacterized protein LOC106150391 isoform X1 [Lingula anatina]XP_013378599.1 uncharacterized protein LOC106150391 isoform X1 [Lingula anatina]XP_013378600.1 uncharacterized protein LOC106150391 isoform X1 [Lingula anatina]|eukprot:XP_013378598.1 uncharacterized protein LOC106150391 isoform X1 [Lingula anatina]
MERMLLLVLLTLLPMSALCNLELPYNESVACDTPDGIILKDSMGHIRQPENPEMYRTETRGGYSVFRCLWTIPLETGQTMSIDVTPKLKLKSCNENVLTIGIKKNMVDGAIKDPIFKQCGENRMDRLPINETTVILYRATIQSMGEFSIQYNISGPCPTLHGPFEGGKLKMNSATRATLVCNEGLVRESKPTLNKQRIICNRTTNTWTEELDRCVTVSSFTTLPGVAASTVQSTTSSEASSFTTTLPGVAASTVQFTTLSGALGNGEASNGNGTALVIVISLLVVVLIVIAIVVAVCLSVRAKRRESIKESRIIADRLQVNALYSKELQETPVGDSNNGSINDINREHNAQTDEKNDDQTAAEAQLLLGENDDRKEGSKMYEEIGNPGTAENGDIVPVDGEDAEKPVYAVVHKDKGDKWKTAEVPDDVEMKDNELYGTDERV